MKNLKLGTTILHVACLTLGAIFLVSLVGSFGHLPTRVSGWVKLAVSAIGLYYVYDVIRYKTPESASSLGFIGICLGGSSILNAAFLFYTLRGALPTNEAMAPLNSIIWNTMTLVLVIGSVQCLCGAAFWLPTVKRQLASHGLDGIDDDWFDFEDIELGPPITMSGPEFLEWVKENGGQRTPDGFRLYIKIPESLMPEERHRKYADPLHHFLETEGLGFVDGGGTRISAERKHVEFVYIDVLVFEKDAGVEAIVQIMRRLKSPKGTEIHVADEGIVEVWSGDSQSDATNK